MMMKPDACEIFFLFLTHSLSLSKTNLKTWSFPNGKNDDDDDDEEDDKKLFFWPYLI